MNASAILEDLARRGVSVEARGGKLRLAPARAIDPELRSLLLQHKAELLSALSSPCSRPANQPDLLTDLFETPLRDLKAPLPVDSAILGERIYFVANDQQAATGRAQGGVAYTPAEVEILWELCQAVGPEVWARRLKLIHEAKQRFEGAIIRPEEL